MLLHPVTYATLHTSIIISIPCSKSLRVITVSLSQIVWRLVSSHQATCPKVLVTNICKWSQSKNKKIKSLFSFWCVLFLCMYMHIFTYAHFRMSLQFGAWISFLAYLNRRLLCRYYRLLYSFSAHQTGMTQSAVVGRSQDERGKTKGGSVAWKKTPKYKTECSFQPQPSLGEVWKGERIPMQITKWLPFINAHFILLKKTKKKVMRCL